MRLPTPRELMIAAIVLFMLNTLGLLFTAALCWWQGGCR